MLNQKSVPGEIKVSDDDAWIKLSESEEKKIFSMLRDYGDGKVFVAGHGSVLTRVNSPILLRSAVGWLNLSNDEGKILISSGHCEIASLIKKNPYGLPALKLQNQLQEWEYTVNNISAPIDETKLREGNILVIGNAWGNFTQSEIDAVENFVKNGGSLLVVGSGWPWRKYSDPDVNPNNDPCRGQTVGQNIKDISTYPMNRLVEPYKMQWTEQRIFLIPHFSL